MLDFRGKAVVHVQIDVEGPAAFGVVAFREELRNDVCVQMAAVEAHVRCRDVPDVDLGGLHGGFAAVERFDLLEAWGERGGDVRGAGAEFKEAVFAIRVDGVLDAGWKREPGILDAGRPVQNVHAETGACNRHKVVAERALGFDFHSLSLDGVEESVGQTLDLVTTDDFGATALEEIDKRLVTVRGEFPFHVDLDEKRKASIARGAEPDLAEGFLENVQMVLVNLFENAVHKFNRLHIAGWSVDGEQLLCSAVFLDDSPVGVFRDCIGGKPGLQLSGNAVVFHPCCDLSLDVVKREDTADYGLVGLCGLLFEFIVLADIGLSGSVELASGEGLAYSIAHSVLFSTAWNTIILFVHFQIGVNKFIL